MISVPSRPSERIIPGHLNTDLERYTKICRDFHLDRRRRRRRRSHLADGPLRKVQVEGVDIQQHLAEIRL
jgi:hypothetical protein